MTRIMRDSTNPADIPADHMQLVAGYINGLYAWSDADWARFGGLGHVTIDVTGGRPDADVLDVERGNASVSTAVRWTLTKYRQQHDYPPVIYCDRETVGALKAAMTENNLQPGLHYWLAVATLDGTRLLPDMHGVCAVQYAGENQTGGHYDEWIVYDDAWKPAAHTPPRAPAPAWPGRDFTYDPDHAEMQGEDVRDWQLEMSERGWKITVDGVYGQQSEHVCCQFQEDSTAHGWPLTVDGIVGPKTWRATWERPVS